MVDEVLGEIADPADDDWRVELHQRAFAMREVLLRHPWAIGLMESATLGPENLHYHDAMMGCLLDKAGLSVAMAVHAYGVLNAFTYGFSFQERALKVEHPSEGAEGVPVLTEDALGGPAYPHLRAAHDEVSRKGYDFNDEFTFAVGVILDAIDRLRGPDGSGARR
jgi:hypothetical protein